jgi:hypothetical protein
MPPLHTGRNSLDEKEELTRRRAEEKFFRFSFEPSWKQNVFSGHFGRRFVSQYCYVIGWPIPREHETPFAKLWLFNDLQERVDQNLQPFLGVKTR